MGAKSQIIRDARLRFSVEANEVKRRALLYIARNATLESQVRHRAQLQLHNMDGNTRPGRVSNRCMETGRGRGELECSIPFGSGRFKTHIYSLSPGIMSQFGLCRVSQNNKAVLLCKQPNQDLGGTSVDPVSALLNTVSIPTQSVERRA
jgi:small subunit ribosomal protein S14